jgi:hypothetical protein
MELSFHEKSAYLIVKATGAWTTSEMPWQIERMNAETALKWLLEPTDQ